MQTTRRSRAAAADRRAVPAGDDGDGIGPSPRWPWLAGLVLCFFGLGVASYLTYEHYTGSTSLSCPAGGGAINCLKVTTSTYSEVFGIPVAVLGLIFFVIMAPLQIPAAWRSQRREIRMARLGWAVVGMGTAIWLVYAELFKIDAICLWCTSVHIATFLLFVATIFATLSTAALDPDPA